MSEVIELPAGLRLARYRIAFSPEARLVLPRNVGAMLRGGLGMALKRGTCARPAGKLCGRCELPDVCPYSFIFESPTPADTDVLRASSEIPPPYVLEPSLNQERVIEAGGRLEFGLVLFGQAARYFPYALAALRELGQQGLGPNAIRCRLAGADLLGLTGEARSLYDDVAGRLLGSQPPAPSVTSWVGEIAAPADRAGTAGPGDQSGIASTTVTLHFLTPTRLKHADRFVEGPPAFHVVIRALLRRVSSLSYFYGGQRWEVDYRGWIERAEQVQIADAEVRWVDWERFSTRQQREMNLGGIVGRVTYAGDRGQEAGDRGQGTGSRSQESGVRNQESGGSSPLANVSADQLTNLPTPNLPTLEAFLPLLRLGELVHVGKAAVFGNGRYELQIANGK
jgi:hypothetical protein